MHPGAWLTLAGVCITGAMSPGPSLALVLSRTLARGRWAGARAAIGHGFGVGLYAGIAVGGLAVVLTAAPVVYTTMQVLGALFLGWMGIGLLRAGGASESTAGSGENDLLDGFLLAFLNPKIAVFFLALFSQLADPNATSPEKVGMAIMAGTIDTAWYLVVALLIGGPALSGWLEARQTTLNRVMGSLLCGLAIWVFIHVWSAT
ncbi:MAG: lysine transporter LysE [Deltaproteobacteria bacterium]|nr:lysine transporter LysE [Deltaproteobacteria bacterium]HCH62506.1 lysine transporter LysE [Deltaproteobacteria bacterium]